jgi:hypothetical protein
MTYSIVADAAHPVGRGFDRRTKLIVIPILDAHPCATHGDGVRALAEEVLALHRETPRPGVIPTESRGPTGFGPAGIVVGCASR